MKRKVLGLLVILGVVMCMTAGTGSAMDLASQEVDWAAGLAAQETGVECRIISFDRTPLIDNIYKYSFIFKVGDDGFDKIGVYRVVKEKRPWVPIRAQKGVMMVHGDSSSFESAFLMSTLSPAVLPEDSLGIYLAENNIDVWGVDRRWTFVPDETEDFSFMEDWDTALHLGDMKLSVKFARLIRALTGSGWGKIFMLGHSSGAAFAYAYANEETQVPVWRRDLKGIIPLDMVYKFDPQETTLIANACQRYNELKAKYDSEIYYSDEAAQMKGIAYLALTAPDDPSPIPGFEWLNNMQMVLLAGSATYATYEPVPFYHYFAGIFDEYNLPTGLQFTNFAYMLDFAFAVPSFQSLGEQIDGEALWCDECDVPYDDHLADIKIPVFYVGVAGGFGAYGEYTLDLLVGSEDKESLIVELYPVPPYPPEAVAVDYGHADLLLAGDAQTLVWEPIYEWIKSH